MAKKWHLELSIDQLQNNLFLWGFWILFPFLCSMVVFLIHMGRFLLTLFKWSKTLSSELPVSLPAKALVLFQYLSQATGDWKSVVLHFKPNSQFWADTGPVQLCRSFHFLDPWQWELIEKKIKPTFNSLYKL